MVVGGSGCGKSRVAQRLAESLRLPCISKDALIWKAGWMLTPRSEWPSLFEAATDGPAWIYDGNVSGIDDPGAALVVARADTILWIDLPRWRVMTQLALRTFRRVCTGEELWHGNRESWRGSFLSRDSVILWGWSSYPGLYQSYSRIFAEEVNPGFRHLVRIRLRSRREIVAWLADIKNSRTFQTDDIPS